MDTYRITCRETVYFVKEVKANSTDEASEKLTADVNRYETVKEWIEEWEIADTPELKEDHIKGWVDLPPRHNTRKKP
tara:strand:+ start:410 stop:640 length:231 start_codon:yes stop_codon:yes gene_type:complete